MAQEEVKEVRIAGNTDVEIDQEAMDYCIENNLDYRAFMR